MAHIIDNQVWHCSCCTDAASLEWSTLFAEHVAQQRVASCGAVLELDALAAQGRHHLQHGAEGQPGS